MKLNSRHEYRTVDHAQGEERPKAKHRGPARCPPVSPGVAATSQHSAVTPSAPGRGRLAGRAAVPGAAAGTAPPTTGRARTSISYLRSHVALSERGPSQGDGRRSRRRGAGGGGRPRRAARDPPAPRAGTFTPALPPGAGPGPRARNARWRPAYVGSREPQARSRCAVSAERCSGCSHEKRSPGPRPPGDSGSSRYSGARRRSRLGWTINRGVFKTAT